MAEEKKYSKHQENKDLETVYSLTLQFAKGVTVRAGEEQAVGAWLPRISQGISVPCVCVCLKRAYTYNWREQFSSVESTVVTNKR